MKETVLKPVYWERQQAIKQHITTETGRGVTIMSTQVQTARAQLVVHNDFIIRNE